LLFIGLTGAIQALWDSFIADDLLFLVGSVGWVVAVVAAAVASRRAGAPCSPRCCWPCRRWPSSTPRRRALDGSGPGAPVG
jgi:hypothetical protein